MKNNFKYLAVENGIFLRFGFWKSYQNQKMGTICLLGGRTEYMEKYFQTIRKLNQKGMDVFSFDWRGQGLSTRIIKNRRKGYIRNYKDYVDDLSVFIEKILKKKASEPCIIMGHSMGGHIIIRYLHDHENIFNSAILISPMIDIQTFPVPKSILQRIIRILVKAGYDKVYLPGGDSLMKNKFKGNALTSDQIRFEKAQKFVIDNPDVAIGGVTLGWLNASFDSINLLNQPGYVEKIKTRILIFSADKDRIVCNRAQVRLCKRLPNCRLIKVSGSSHEILQEKDAIQKTFWNVFKYFPDFYF
jgi:lysophospholipase